MESRGIVLPLFVLLSALFSGDASARGAARSVSSSIAPTTVRVQGYRRADGTSLTTTGARAQVVPLMRTERASERTLEHGTAPSSRGSTTPANQHRSEGVKDQHAPTASTSGDERRGNCRLQIPALTSTKTTYNLLSASAHPAFDRRSRFRFPDTPSRPRSRRSHQRRPRPDEPGPKSTSDFDARACGAHYQRPSTERTAPKCRQNLSQ
jgi:hypothetical protein